MWARRVFVVSFCLVACARAGPIDDFNLAMDSDDELNPYLEYAPGTADGVDAADKECKKDEGESAAPVEDFTYFAPAVARKSQVLARTGLVEVRGTDGSAIDFGETDECMSTVMMNLHDDDTFWLDKFSGYLCVAMSCAAAALRLF